MTEKSERFKMKAAVFLCFHYSETIEIAGNSVMYSEYAQELGAD